MLNQHLKVKIKRSVGVFALLFFASQNISSTANAAFEDPIVESWKVVIDGWNRTSSPVIADIDNDGKNEIVLGHQDGMLRAYDDNGALKWEVPAIPGVNKRICRSQSAPTAIDSSPAVADIDGDGVIEIIVGLGSAFVPYQNGSVISVDGRNGKIEWAFNRSRDTASLWDGAKPIPDRWCEATYSTPAIGDVNRDGKLDVVFGSWDFRIWAVDGQGEPLVGFPVNNDDTVWSSPSLFDIDRDGDVEIFIGGDSTPGGYTDHLGGIFRAIDYRNNKPVSLWNRFANEVYHSSPAIGDINGDGRLEVIVGMGNNWYIECTHRGNPSCNSGDGSDHNKVWAYHVDDGSNVPGWPVNAAGTIWSSPAIGDVDNDGTADVIAGSYDKKVYVWNGDGEILWSVVPTLFNPNLPSGRVTGPPIVADLDGDGDQDVAIGTEIGLALLDGQNGSSLNADSDWRSRDLISFAISYESAPAIGNLNGIRHLVISAFDTPKKITYLAAYPLPVSEAEDAWPMFRQGPSRQGLLQPNYVDSTALADVIYRDRLIRKQELLLNIYRCLYRVDIQAVLGGCINSQPKESQNKVLIFQGIPNQSEIILRDHLISQQESLLNAYRCQFAVDIQLVPGNCLK